MTEQEFVQRVKEQNKKLYLSALSVVKNAADAENYAELVEENSRVYWETAGRVR